MKQNAMGDKPFTLNAHVMEILIDDGIAKAVDAALAERMKKSESL